jgi:hypothetical protein
MMVVYSSEKAGHNNMYELNTFSYEYIYLHNSSASFNRFTFYVYLMFLPYDSYALVARKTDKHTGRWREVVCRLRARHRQAGCRS